MGVISTLSMQNQSYQVRFAYVSFRSATQDGVPLVDSAIPCVLLKIITVFAVFLSLSATIRCEDIEVEMLFYQWFPLFSGAFCHPAQESACASMTFPDSKVVAIQ